MSTKPKVDVSKPSSVSPKNSPKPSSPKSTLAISPKSQAPVVSLSKQMSGLSVATSGQRRLSTSGSTAGSSSPVSASSPQTGGAQSPKDPASVKLTQTRRRLSIMGGGQFDPKLSLAALDGALLEESKEAKDVNKVSRVGDGPLSPRYQEATHDKKQRIFHSYSSLSRVGFVPFNPNKVNQDRPCELVTFGGLEEKAFFAVFDGHGALGHEVSQFCTNYLPQFFFKTTRFRFEPKRSN